MTFKAAVVGLGPQGKRIIEVIDKIADISLIALADKNEKSLESIKNRKTVNQYSDVDTLLNHEEIDLICIATNGPSHAVIAEKSIKHGVKYLMIEKPMACSVAECDLIYELSAKYNVRLAVNQSRRHCAMYQWIQNEIRKEEEWGKPRCIWIQRPGIGLGNLGTHSFDLVSYLTGKQVVVVSAWIDKPVKTNPRGKEFVDPGGLVVLELEGGARAVISQIEDGSGPMSVEIDMTGGRIRIDEKYKSLELIKRDLSVIPGPNRPPVFAKIDPPIDLDLQVNMYEMLYGVLTELISDEPVKCDADSGRNSIQILAAAYLSDRKGNQPVNLKSHKKEYMNIWLPVT
ncbi:MAG: gfo/Idh/MocA family oxidoreductase [Desulfobacteraceae bacterium]|nr:MAG: gfo/Idh/MocA family oxidoreductase [Desulfobacteraceae bacterium]